MASERIQGAQQGARVGATTGNPFATAAAAVIGALSSKGSYARTTGIEVTGTLSASGFDGDAYGLAVNGASQYRDSLKNADQSTSPWYHIESSLKRAYSEFFGDSGAVVPVKFVVAADDNYWPSMRDNIARYAANFWDSAPTNPQTQVTNLNPSAYPQIRQVIREQQPNTEVITADNRTTWLVIILFVLIGVFVYIRMK